MVAFVELNSALYSHRGDSDLVSRVYTLVFIPSKQQSVCFVSIANTSTHR